MRLDLDSLGKVAKLSPVRCAALAEAAAVCLDHHHHGAPTRLRVRGTQNLLIELTWRPIDAARRRSWADLQEAVEDGACGIALLLLPSLMGYTAIERAVKGTRVDYYLGYANPDERFPFQRKARLEVSGILKGDAGDVDARLDVKRRQVQKSAETTPGIVSITEFGHPQSVLDKA